MDDQQHNEAGPTHAEHVEELRRYYMSRPSDPSWDAAMQRQSAVTNAIIALGGRQTETLERAVGRTLRRIARLTEKLGQQAASMEAERASRDRAYHETQQVSQTLQMAHGILDSLGAPQDCALHERICRLYDTTEATRREADAKEEARLAREAIDPLTDALRRIRRAFHTYSGVPAETTAFKTWDVAADVFCKWAEQHGADVAERDATIASFQMAGVAVQNVVDTLKAERDKLYEQSREDDKRMQAMFAERDKWKAAAERSGWTWAPGAPDPKPPLGPLREEAPTEPPAPTTQPWIALAKAVPPIGEVVEVDRDAEGEHYSRASWHPDNGGVWRFFSTGGAVATKPTDLWRHINE